MGPVLSIRPFGAASQPLTMLVSSPKHDLAVFAAIATLIAMMEVALLLAGIASLGLWLWFAGTNGSPLGA